VGSRQSQQRGRRESHRLHHTPTATTCQSWTILNCWHCNGSRGSTATSAQLKLSFQRMQMWACSSHCSSHTLVSLGKWQQRHRLQAALFLPCLNVCTNVLWPFHPALIEAHAYNMLSAPSLIDDDDDCFFLATISMSAQNYSLSPSYCTTSLTLTACHCVWQACHQSHVQHSTAAAAPAAAANPTPPPVAVPPHCP